MILDSYVELPVVPVPLIQCPLRVGSHFKDNRSHKYCLQISPYSYHVLLSISVFLPCSPQHRRVSMDHLLYYRPSLFSPCSPEHSLSPPWSPQHRRFSMDYVLYYRPSVSLPCSPQHQLMRPELI
jgi:hypothetical protein